LDFPKKGYLRCIQRACTWKTSRLEKVRLDRGSAPRFTWVHYSIRGHWGMTYVLAACISPIFCRVQMFYLYNFR
jgi:hypothetical protein